MEMFTAFEMHESKVNMLEHSRRNGLRLYEIIIVDGKRRYKDENVQNAYVEYKKAVARKAAKNRGL